MAEKKVKVQAELLTEEFELFKNQSERIRTLLSLRKHSIPTFWALKGISFKIYEGEAIGIIGINGSGKSTLSNIISGIIPQTSGYLNVYGDVSIISIGTGLKFQLTGRENIRIKALMMGMTNAKIDEIQAQIIAFADLGDFIDQPVKNYSSGMRARLGFAIAIHQDPDILIIDEALSVGDQTFYQKCIAKILEFKRQGKTIIFVSHVLRQVGQLCDRVMWIHYGDLREFGPAKQVLAHYGAFIKRFNQLPAAKKKAYQLEAKKKQAEFEVTDLLPKPYTRRNKYHKPAVLRRTSIGASLSWLSRGLLAFLVIGLVFLGYFICTTPAEALIYDSPRQSQTAASHPVEQDGPQTKQHKQKTAHKKNASQASDTNDTMDSSTKTDSEEQATATYYTVKAGDTYTSIAQRFGVTPEALIELNDTDDIAEEGQVLTIPESE